MRSIFSSLGPEGEQLQRVVETAATSEAPSREEAARLLATLDRADARWLGSLCTEPLRATELVGTREEHFSDWLAWLCERVGGPLVCELLGIDGGLLDTNTISVQRETMIQHGHDGHGGRLDLLLRGAGKQVVIELKLNDADFADTAKHKGYAASIHADAFVLLAAGGSLGSYDRFVLRTWEDLAGALRRALPELAERSRLVACVAYCFVDAIETRILGFGPELRRAVEQQSFIGPRLPLWIAYLRELAGEKPVVPPAQNVSLDSAFAHYWAAHVALRKLREHGIAMSVAALEHRRAAITSTLGASDWQVMPRVSPDTIDAHARQSAWIGARVATTRGLFRCGIWFFADKVPWAFVELVANDRADANNVAHLLGDPKDRMIEQEGSGVALCAALSEESAVADLLGQLVDEFVGVLAATR